METPKLPRMRAVEQGPQEVPQIVEETGVSADYSNEFNWAFMSDEEYFAEDAKDKAKARGKLLPRYEERFPTDEYPGATTDKNRKAVAAINAIADEVNAAHAAGTLTHASFREATTRLAKVLYGASLPAGYG